MRYRYMMIITFCHFYFLQIRPACFGGPSIVPKDYSSYGYNKFGFDQSYFNNLENVSKHFKKTNRTLTAIGWGMLNNSYILSELRIYLCSIYRLCWLESDQSQWVSGLFASCNTRKTKHTFSIYKNKEYQR